MPPAEVCTITPTPIESKFYVTELARIFDGRDDIHTRHYWITYKALLEHGKVYTEIDFDLSRKLRRRFDFQNRECFKNSQHLAEEGYTYIEGIGSGLIPTEHAWVVHADRPDVVIDVTWCNCKFTKPPDFFGVAIPLEFIHRCQRTTETYGSIMKPWLLLNDPEFKGEVDRMLYWL